MVVVYLHRVPCPRAEGGAYNSTGRGARACNTFWALRRPEGSKAPVQSFPGSTFPAGAQGMGCSTMVLTYEHCPALLRMPSGSYKSPSEGRGVGVQSSAAGKVL